MPLRDDLLNPIPGANPSGANLRYEKVYDQIKEARTENEESILGGLASPKRADYVTVIKLAGEALATRSKDLQIAAWLTEAHAKREGIALIQPCIQLLFDLQGQFWGTLYPEIEDGDAGMRAGPIEWAANRMADILRSSPITKDKLSFIQYKESRAVGYEADIEYNDEKRRLRNLAINEDGKIPPEDFDKSVAVTPKSFYVDMDAAISSSLTTLDELQVFCEEKYGDDGPGFGKLRTALEEVGQVVGSLLNEKRKLEPDEPVEEEAAPEPEPEAEAEPEPDSAPSPVAAKARPGKSLSAEPTDKDDAIARIQACARFLQNETPASPVPYLVLAGLRMGEMREQGSWASWDFLVPPTTERRQNIKRLSSEGSADELLAEAITAVGEPCGRAWLDVHRYIWKASYDAGYSAITASVISTLQGLLNDLPDASGKTFSDDTPVANPETLRWLEENVIPKPPEAVAAEAEPEPEPEPELYAPSRDGESEAEPGGPPDVLDMAREMMGRGQLSQAIQLLMRDAAQQPSGRARFLRRLQIAQLCMNAGKSKVAHPVLDELVKEVEQRRLEEWEATEMIAPTYALLLRCLDNDGDSAAREALFAKLCRIDPIAAMDASR